ncbi:MAG: hypothetical protein U9Q67_02675 [Patescibacteria group bacterium]|nr:hypothetical protein [Patescibacteria group bacterium]
MTKKVDDCVKRLMADKDFKPLKGKTKEESAWAVCNAKHKKDKKECNICDITDDNLFKEAVSEIIKTLSEEKPNEESFILEGINFSAFDETISDEDLAKINKFTVKPVKSSDISVYTALLIDDKITRNHTQYNKDFQNMLLSLPYGEGNFMGAPILFGDKEDHQHAASAQVGRIFEAWQVMDADKHYGVMSKIYVIKDTNEDLITKIDSGVLKELSISTKVEIPLCSICKQNIKDCEHIRGEKGCFVIMTGKGFVAEASFVAVPGSNAAKILNQDELKNFLKVENLRELITPIVNETLTSIPTVSQESVDSINAEMELIKVGVERMIKRFDEEQELAASGNLREGEIGMPDLRDRNGRVIRTPQDSVSYPINILSFLQDMKVVLEDSKDFAIRNLGKYNLPVSEFRSDIIPELTQGLKGEDVQFTVKLFFDNLGILGINISKLEVYLKVTPEQTNPTYTGDINNIPMVLRFMDKQMDVTKNRISKLQGRFNLEKIQKRKLIEETVKLGVLCNRFKFEEKAFARKLFDNFSTEEIIKLKEEWFNEGSAIFTPKKLEEKPTEKKKTTEVKPKLSPNEIAKKITGGKTNG